MSQRSTAPTGLVQETLTAERIRLLKTPGKVQALVLFPVRVETLLAPGRPSIFTKTQPLGTEVVPAKELKSSLNKVCAPALRVLNRNSVSRNRRFLSIVS